MRVSGPVPLPLCAHGELCGPLGVAVAPRRFELADAGRAGAGRARGLDAAGERAHLRARHGRPRPQVHGPRRAPRRALDPRRHRAPAACHLRLRRRARGGRGPHRRSESAGSRASVPSSWSRRGSRSGGRARSRARAARWACFTRSRGSSGTSCWTRGGCRRRLVPRGGLEVAMGARAAAVARLAPGDEFLLIEEIDNCDRIIPEGLQPQLPCDLKVKARYATPAVLTGIISIENPDSSFWAAASDRYVMPTAPLADSGLVAPMVAHVDAVLRDLALRYPGQRLALRWNVLADIDQLDQGNFETRPRRHQRAEPGPARLQRLHRQPPRGHPRRLRAKRRLPAGAAHHPAHPDRRHRPLLRGAHLRGGGGAAGRGDRPPPGARVEHGAGGRALRAGRAGPRPSRHPGGAVHRRRRDGAARLHARVQRHLRWRAAARLLRAARLPRWRRWGRRCRSSRSRRRPSWSRGGGRRASAGRWRGRPRA